MACKKGTEAEWLGEENDQHFLMLYRKPMVIVQVSLKKQVNVLAIHWLRSWHISKPLGVWC
jgi:hypothetical protein